MQTLSYSKARKDLKEVLDAVESGQPVFVERRSRRTALVDAENLRRVLAESHLGRPEAVAEGDGWSLLIPGVPVAVDASEFDEAVDEMVLALREYAEDWVDRLHTVPNHTHHWALIQFVALSSDDQLVGWIRGEGG